VAGARYLGRRPKPYRVSRWARNLLDDPDAWHGLPEDDRDAVRAFAHHLVFRFQQDEHPALIDGQCVILSNAWVQCLLKRVGARKQGQKSARAAIATLEQLGIVEFTGEWLNAEKQINADHFYRWRIFRVPAIAQIYIYISKHTQGGYWDFSRVPRNSLSLLAELRCQGLFQVPERLRNANRGSVQWVFRNSGPP